MPLPATTEASWPAVRASALEVFLPTLEALRRDWGLPVAPWRRLPGGEDSAVLALGDTHAVKLLPTGMAAVAAREVDLLGRVAAAAAGPDAGARGSH